MEILSPERTVNAYGIGETHTSTIHATPQMFEVLSNQLYTNKPAAIVRELVCNAIDAHLEAGKADTPIRIHLPTFLEPHFEVRDYGTGIDPTDVPDRMMSFGGGDKHTKADLIGAFGLGMKSPWSLTDQFTVETRWHGRKVLFSAYIQESGLPGCAQLSEVETDEPNGVTVYVPLGTTHLDTASFAQTLMAIYRRSPVAITVSPERDWVEPESCTPLATIDRPVEGVQKTEIIPGRPGVVVTMGPVPYQLNNVEYLGAIREYLDEDTDALWFNLRHNYGFELHVDLGVVQVTASREAISEDQRTKDFLHRALVESIKQLKERLENHVQHADTFYQWITALMLLEKPREGFLNALPDTDWANYIEGPYNAAAIRICHTELLRSVGKVRTLAERTSIGRRKFKSNPKSTSVNAKVLTENTKILVNKKPIPYSRYLQDQYEWGKRYVLIVQGDIDKVRTHIESLGLPIEVEELPEIEPSPVKATSTNRLGAAQYTSAIIGHNSDGEITITESVELTVQAILDHGGQTSVILTGIKGLAILPNEVKYLVRQGLARLSAGKTIIVAHVPKKHTRVRRALIEELGAVELDNSYDDLGEYIFKDLELDFDKAARRFADIWLGQYLPHYGRFLWTTQLNFRSQELLHTLVKRTGNPAFDDAMYSIKRLTKFRNKSIIFDHSSTGIVRWVMRHYTETNPQLGAELQRRIQERFARRKRWILRGIARHTLRVTQLKRILPGIDHVLNHRWQHEQQEAIVRFAIANIKQGD